MNKFILVTILVLFGFVISTAQTTIVSDGTDSLLFFTGGNKIMTVSPSGQIRIGNTGPFNPDALLQLNSTTQGLLLPRLTTAQVTAMGVVPDGLIIYNTSTNKYMFQTNGSWGNALTSSGTDNVWQTNGNSGTNSSTTFLGTTDNRTLNFRTANVIRFTLDSIGNVGLGITSTGAKLHIITGATSEIARFDAPSGSKDPFVTWHSGALRLGYIQMRDEGAGNRWARLGVDDGPIYFNTNATDKMVINVAGNVGIGTTNPVRLLHLAAETTPTLLIDETGGAANAKKWGYNANGGIFYGFTQNDANNATINWLEVNRTGTIINSVAFPNGNVGVGTSTPSGKLHIYSPAMDSDGINNDGIGAADDGGEGNVLIAKDNGWVGIRTASPSAPLHIAQGNSGTALYFTRPNHDTYNLSLVANKGLTIRYITDGSRDEMFFDGEGNIGINNTSQVSLFSVGSSSQFQVNTNGNIVKLNNVTISFPSSNSAGVLTNDGAGTLTWATSPAAGWGLTGNSGTVDGTNFIGTTDDIPFNIRVNNQRAGRIDRPLENTFFGYQAGNSNTSGSNNTANGDKSMFSNTGGANNTASGNYSLYLNTAGNSNTAFGRSALHSNTTGSNNTAIGFTALVYNTTGNSNTASGLSSLNSNTTGSENTAAGNFSLYSNTTGSNNSAFGMYSLSSNTTGINNTAVGFASLNSTTTGNNNAALGYNSLYSNTTGYENTASGYQSLFSNTTGFQNSANGNGALRSNTTGSYNNAQGYQTLFSNTTGAENTATGTQALFSNTTGNNNTANGLNALNLNTTGTNNVALGYQSGYTSNGANANTTGSNNTFLGYNTGYPNSTQRTNATAIGYNAKVDADNALILGGTGADAVNVGIGTVAPLQPLDVYNKLQIDNNGNIVKLNNVTTSFPSSNTSGVLTNNGSGTLSWASPTSDWGLTGNAGTTSSTNFLGTTDNRTLNFRTNNLNRVTVDSTGNVGIGLTAPNVKLHVATGDTATNTFTDIIKINHSSTGTTAAGFATGLVFTGENDAGTDKKFMARIQAKFTSATEASRTASLQFTTVNNTAITTKMTIDGPGNVGIGTTTPVSQLSVGSSSEFQVNSTGNIVKLNNVITSFPSSQGAASTVLTNNGSGILTWTAGPTPTGSAGGDLTGTYPNPTINSDKVTSTHIFDGTITNVDLSASAGIARNKMANGTANHVLINDGGGAIISEAQLALSRGGTNAALTANAGAVVVSTSSALALSAVGSTGQLLSSNGTSAPGWVGLAGLVRLDQVASATSGASFVNGANATSFSYDAFTGANANAFAISSAATTGTGSSSSRLLNIARSGTNTNAAHTAYGLYSTVVNTNGVSGTNVAGYFSASGATTGNNAILVPSGGGNVGIGTVTPNASSIVDISSTSKGLLIPRVSLTSVSDASTIGSPTTSLLVYNSNASMTSGGIGFWYWEGAKWVQLVATGAQGSINTNYFWIVDEKAQNIDGGSSTADSWITRTLNTELADVGNNVTISGNIFTLQPGTYEIEIQVPAASTGDHMARLWNTTDNVLVARSLSGSTSVSTDWLNFKTIFSITSVKSFKVEHQCTVSQSTTGLGIASNITGEVERYTSVFGKVR